MPVNYFEMIRKALEYFELIGGLCAFCKNCERVLTSGEVYCKLHGRTYPAIICRSYEPEARLTTGPLQGEKREGVQ